MRPSDQKKLNYLTILFLPGLLHCKTIPSPQPAVAKEVFVLVKQVCRLFVFSVNTCFSFFIGKLVLQHANALLELDYLRSHGFQPLEKSHRQRFKNV